MPIECGNSRALGALIQLYEKFQQPVHGIFDHLYHHLETEKVPMKETLVVSIGVFGRYLINSYSSVCA